MRMLSEEEHEALKSAATLCGMLLCLLDRIELESDPSLAQMRFEMAEQCGMEVEFRYEGSGDIH